MAQRGLTIRNDVTVNERSLEAAARRIQSRLRQASTVDGRAIEGISRPLGKITGQADEFTKSLAASNARVIAFGASVAIINGVSDAFRGLVTQTIKVEKAFADINVVLNANQRDLKRFGDGIFEVAKNTAQSFDTVAEGALEFARQGLSMEESLKRINDALILTRLTGLDVTESVEGLTAAVNTFKKEGITTAQVINKLAELDIAFAVSSEDLIKGLERAGGSANQARVSFEELAAMIAVVQERTARGGSVIGNALRTIFARLQGAEAISAVEGVGVAVRDVEGNFRSTTDVLEDLAAKFGDLNDITQADIIQKVAGKRQRETLIALFDEMESGTGRWADALDKVASGADTAYQKNEQLNQTLDAIVKQTGVSVQQLAARIGELGFNENFKEIVSGFNTLIENITGFFDEESGSKIGQAFIKGIGGALTSAPVIGLLLAIFGKLIKDVAAFGVTGLKSLLGLNKAAQQQQTLQEAILHTLQREPVILEELTRKGITRAQQEGLLLKVLRQQEESYKRLAQLSRSLTPGLFNSGVRSTPRGIVPTSAGGYVPALAQEQENIQRGVGGARGGDKPVVINDFKYGRGKSGPIVAHSGEYLVDNYMGSGGTAVFNRDMIDQMGLPRGAKPVAARGYIPNFAINPYLKYGPAKLEEIKAKGIPRGDEADFDEAYAAKNKKRGLGVVLKANRKIGVAAAIGSSGTRKIETSVFSGPEREELDRLKLGNINRIVMEGVQVRTLEDMTRGLRNEKQLRKEVAHRFLEPLAGFGESIVGRIFSGDERRAIQGAMEKIETPDLFSTSVEGGIFEAAVKLVTQGAKAIKEFSTNANEQVPFDFEEGSAATDQFKKAFNFDKQLIKADAKRTSTADAIRTMIGKSLRARVIGRSGNSLVKIANAAEGYIPNFASPLQNVRQAFPNRVELTRFADRARGGDPRFRKIFSNLGIKNIRTKRGQPIDYSRMDDRELLRAIDKETLRGNPRANYYWELVNSIFEQNPTWSTARVVRELRGRTGNKISFADGYDPLLDAIGREQGAGLPLSQIRVNQDGRLRNAKNPMGLAVTNTRDEPTGRIPFGADGYVPNFAVPASEGLRVAQENLNKLGDSSEKSSEKIEGLGKTTGKTRRGLEGSLGSIFALQTIAFGASEALGSFGDEADSGMTRFSQAATEATSALISLSLISQSTGGGGLVKLLGLGGAGKLFPTFGKIIPLATKSFSRLIPVLGQALFLFQGVNAVMKALTGEGVFDKFRDKVGESTRNLEEFSKGLSSKSTVNEIKESAEAAFKAAKLGVDVESLQTEEAKQLFDPTKLSQDINSVFEKQLQSLALDIAKNPIKRTPSFGNPVLGQVSNPQDPREIQRSALERTRDTQLEFADAASQSLDNILAAYINSLSESGATTDELKNVSDKFKVQQEAFSEAAARLIGGAGATENPEQLQKNLETLISFFISDRFGAIAKAADEEIRKGKAEDERKIVIALSKFRSSIDDYFQGAQLAADRELQFGAGTVGRGANSAVEKGGVFEFSPFEVNTGPRGLLDIERDRATRVLSDQAAIDLDFEEKRLRAAAEYEAAQRKVNQQLIEEVVSKNELSTIDQELADGLLKRIESGEKFASLQNDLNNLVENESLNKSETLLNLEKEVKRLEERYKLTQDTLKAEEKIERLRAAPKTFGQGLQQFAVDLNKEIDGFEFQIGQTIPSAFRDGMVDAMQAAINGAEDLGSTMSEIARNFLLQIQRAFLQNAANNIVSATGTAFGLQGFNSGGMVTGGSGIRDDVPATLTGGEFVIRKAAVKKYGEEYLESLNSGKLPGMANGGYYFPIGDAGRRPQGAIRGLENLRAFAEQSSTAGTFDEMISGQGFAGVNLEARSRKLTAFGMRRGSPIQELLMEQQQQARDLVSEKEESDRRRREEAKEALKQAIVGTLLSFGLSAGAGYVNNYVDKIKFENSLKDTSGSTHNFYGDASVYGGPSTAAKGGYFSKKTNAMLMGGEYVMDRKAVAQYGKNFFESINDMRSPSPRYAMGGGVNTPTRDAAPSNGDTTISIVVNSDGSGQTSAQGQQQQSDMKLAERIKKEVVKIIEEEKRVSGSLSNRRRGV